MVKPSQTGLRKRSGLRVNKGLLIEGQLPGEKAISEQINEVEGLCQYLTSQEIHSLKLRRATDIQTSHTVQNSTQNNTTRISQDEDEVEPTLQDIMPTCLTMNIRKCLESICNTWDVRSVTDIFPVSLWPKEGTLWNLSVFELFLTMARRHPTTDCREGISNKFAELVRARRQRLNAKTQWTIEDAKATNAWARERYSLLGELTSIPELVNNDGTGIRLSQRQRKPSMKATLLKRRERRNKK